MKTNIILGIFALMLFCGPAFAVTTLPTTDPEIGLTDVAASIAAANAVEHSTGLFNGETGEVEFKLPPLRYNHPFAGEIRITWVHPWNAHIDCHSKNPLNYGCQFASSPNVCLLTLSAIDIDGIITVARLQRMLIHERAHCNGWGLYHED